MGDFSRQIEKRVKKQINFKKGEKVYVKGNVAKYFLKQILGDYLVKLVRDKKQADKIVVQQTADDVIDGFVYGLMNKMPKKKDEIPLFKYVTDKELEEYCKRKNLKFKPNKKHQETQLFISNLEEKYPSIKFSLLKSTGYLEKFSVK